MTSILLKLNKILFLFIVSAQISNALTYCLDRNVSLYTARKEIQSIMVNGETVDINARSHCLDVSTREYRSELINKFITMNFKVISQHGGTVSRRGMCKFTLKRIETVDKTKNEVSLGSKNNITKSKTNNNSTSVSQMIVMQGRSALLAVDAENLFLLCEKRGDIYEVEFSLRQKGRPVISTVIDLTPGVWQDVGNIKKNINNKQKKISVSKGLKTSNIFGNLESNYSIMVFE